MTSIPLSSLYLPNIAVYQTQEAAIAAGVPVNWDPTRAPQYWIATLPAGFDPDAPFTIHNLHDANGSAVWGVSYIPNSQAVTLNIPPTPASATNAPVYPNSISIPMVYPMPANDSVADTPFGLMLTQNDPPPAAGSPAPAGTDPTIARILAGVQAILGKIGAPPV